MRTGMENVRPLGLPRGGWRWLVHTGAALLGLVMFLSLGNGQALATPSGGNWVGTYGHEGYDLGGWDGGSSDLVETPGASLTLQQGSRYVWEFTSTDERALEDPEGSTREAAAYYDANKIILQLSFTKAYTGELHLYAVDWTGTTRRETISVGEHVSELNESFHEGAWVSVPIEVSAGGSVTIDVTRTGGSNAVLSGVFLGGSGSPPSLLKPSSSPKGNWVGTYGHEGYDLGGSDNGSNDLVETPEASLKLKQGSRYVWEFTSTDERALEDPEGSTREAATYYDPTELVLQLSFTKAYTGELHLYAVDWTGTTRREAISVAGQTAVLSTSFHEGAWVSVPVEVSAGGSVTINVTLIGGPGSAVLSGVFLGGSGSPPSLLKPSSSPKGNWVGTYGHEGYDLGGGQRLQRPRLKPRGLAYAAAGQPLCVGIH